MALLGKVYMIAVVVTFSIVLMNLIIAILSNTYGVYESGSTGLYLSKILSSRDEIEYDDNFGAFLSPIAPINVLQIPFVPAALSMRRGTPMLM